jgi:hypothetical protein
VLALRGMRFMGMPLRGLDGGDIDVRWEFLYAVDVLLVANTSRSTWVV